MKNKYGAVKTVAYGIKFDSKAEAEFFKHLQLLISIGAIGREIRMQVPYKLHAGIKYIADFVVTRHGQQIPIDVKGVETPVFRLKRKLFNADHGRLDVVKPYYRGGSIKFDWPPVTEGEQMGNRKP